MSDATAKPTQKATTRRRTTKKTAAATGGAHRAERNRRVLQRQIMPIDRDFDVFALYVDPEEDRKSTRLNSSHATLSRMPSSA